MEITFNAARYAVHAALDAVFPDIPISGEEIKQDLDPPRFFVRLLEPAHTRELGRRHRRDHPFVIRYFAPERSNEDMYDMGEQLTSALAWIDINGRKYPGKNINFQIIDEVLHFMVTYSLLVMEQVTIDPKMQHLEQEGSLK
ncbi:phage tail terminator family protein [Paenibacillus sp. FSL K6-1230]|uniref:phage tail terminator family protein n=1 Tax=Paenibacillus sp. FSL K6-1230 TaxID=2921603 RepID=UPI0030FB7CD6